MKFSRKTCLLFTVWVQAHATSAQSPVAIVEDVKGKSPALRPWITSCRAERFGSRGTRPSSSGI